MSRAFGDLIGHKEAGITEQPDYSCINMESGGQMPVAFMICSDGVWEFITADEAAKTVCNSRTGPSSNSETGSKIDPHRAAETLSQESWNRWMIDTEGAISDDISVLIQVL